jgi:hypothetical protein
MTYLKSYALAGLALACGALPLYAQAPTVLPAGGVPRGGCCCPPPGLALPGCPTPSPAAPITPAPGGPEGAVPPAPEAAATPSETLAQPGAGGTQPAAMFDPGMFGDLIGISGRRVIALPPGVTPPAGVPFRAIAGNKFLVVAPLPSRSMYKITENESPRPTDRAYVNYNFFSNVDRVLQGTPGTYADLHRETIGFEKTFLSGDASFGMRLPYLQLTGGSEIEDTHIEDLSMIFKYAFINDRATGNVLSGGLVLTAPTGQGLIIDGESTIHSTVFQPFVGYIYHFNRDLFVQGFSSVYAPTDARDVTVLFNSVAAGYKFYRADDPTARVRGVVPVAEFHVNTPLNHRGVFAGPINFSDSVDFTGGVFVQFRRATLGVAVGTPLTGPKPYDIEATVNLNVHF